MTKHTEGPWTVERYEVKSTHRPEEPIPMFNVLAPNPDAGKSGVCYSGSHFTVAAELDSEPDAALIAAAPQLLEALAALAHEADDFDYGDSAPELVAAIAQARAAIALANMEATE